LEQRATIFVEAMIVIAVIGILAFLIGLVARIPQRQHRRVAPAKRSNRRAGTNLHWR
jgi:Tfp pilus assembly major pilin PilA